MNRQRGALELAAIEVLVAIVGILAWTGFVWHYATTTTAARLQQTIDKQEAALAERDAKIQEQGQQQLLAQVAAFDKGTAQAQDLAKKLFAQGRVYATNNPAFADAHCDIGSDFVQLINYASANMRTAAAAGFSDATMPAATTPAGRQDGNGSATNAGGSQSGGPVGTVHPKPRPTNSTH